MATTFTAGVLASLASWNDPAGAWVAYNTALAGMFEPTYSIVVPQGSPDAPSSYTAGWSTLLDPVNCPAAYLPYCAAFVGVQIPSGTSASAARAMILAERNFQTGTAAAVVAAAQLWLSGSQQVTLLERTAADGSTNSYWFVLIVRPEQVIDAVQLTAAVNAVKPVGVFWTLVQQDAYTWSQALHTWSADTMTWNQTSSTQP